MRQLLAKGASEVEVQATKEKMLQEIYNFLAISFGTPPQIFDFEYRDIEQNYHLAQT